MTREVSSISRVGTSEPVELQISRGHIAYQTNAIAAIFEGILIDNGSSL
jgi:hypothetical protein